MTTTTRDYDREPGYWWIRMLMPICDGGGVLDEEWGSPVVALLEDSEWWLPRSGCPVVFEVEVLGRVAPCDATR